MLPNDPRSLPMNPMTDMFDFNKNFEQFSKFNPDFFNAAPMKAFNDIAAKYREVAVEALNRNVELTTAWMKDAAKDATVLMTAEAQPTAYAKKAGDLATAAFQDLPSRLFAYAEVAKKAQTELFDTVVAVTPKVVEEAAERSKAAAKTTARKVAA
jgi:accessory colonization factor AcfC